MLFRSDARRWVEAADLYRAALEENPKAAPIWVQYGHALKESGSAAEAEAAYRASIGLAPQNPDSYVQLGHALKLQDRRAEAAAAYLRALALDPALDHALIELYRFGWSPDRIERDVARERLRLDSLAL